MTPPQQPGKAGEKTLVFSKPQQIVEILTEADRLKLPILIRYTNDGKAVRGFVERADLNNERGLRIGGISDAGDSVLARYDVVKIEFVLLSKKIFFISRIRARTPSRLLVSTPEKVYAIERRLNARFPVPKGMTALVRFDKVPVDQSRFDAPPSLNIVEPTLLQPSSLLIHDISLGGAALTTRYGGVAQNFAPDQKILEAQFCFPRIPPITAPVTIRWVKKISMRIDPESIPETAHTIEERLTALPTLRNTKLEYNDVVHRFGIQFSEISSELDAALRLFINQAQTAESV
jgi:hypothetical protein